MKKKRKKSFKVVCHSEEHPNEKKIMINGKPFHKEKGQKKYKGINSWGKHFEREEEKRATNPY